MISVVIPLYNKEKYVERTLRSVLNQSYTDYEVVVVNDGSKDGSVAVVEAIADQRIRIVNQENRGVSAARNRGVEESRSEFVAFLDADDEWTPDHLETLAGLIAKYPSCGIFATSYQIKKEGGDTRSPLLSGGFSFSGEEGILDNFFEMASGTNSPIHISSYAVRKGIIQSVGGFPVGILAGEDIMTITKLYVKADIAYSRKETAVYNLIVGGKNVRPLLKKNPMDPYFDSLLILASHRKGVRLYVSSWHKRRMVSALFGRQYGTAVREFSIAFRFFPYHKKLYTSAISTLISILLGKDLFWINKKLGKKG